MPLTHLTAPPSPPRRSCRQRQRVEGVVAANAEKNDVKSSLNSKKTNKKNADIFRVQQTHAHSVSRPVHIWIINHIYHSRQSWFDGRAPVRKRVRCAEYGIFSNCFWWEIHNEREIDDAQCASTTTYISCMRCFTISFTFFVPHTSASADGHSVARYRTLVPIMWRTCVSLISWQINWTIKIIRFDANRISANAPHVLSVDGPIVRPIRTSSFNYARMIRKIVFINEHVQTNLRLCAFHSRRRWTKMENWPPSANDVMDCPF